MATVPKTTDQIGAESFSVPRSAKLDHLFGRIDLLALVVTVFGICLLGIASAVMAMIELARLISDMWMDSFERWLIVALGLAIVWVVARGKKLCVF